jgi:hypothetical protein
MKSEIENKGNNQQCNGNNDFQSLFSTDFIFILSAPIDEITFGKFLKSVSIFFFGITHHAAHISAAHIKQNCAAQAWHFQN